MSKISFSLDADQEAFVNERLAEGQYGNASDYVRNLIRQDQEYARKLAELRQAIQEGIDSGVCDQTVEEIWAEAEAEYLRENG